MKRSRQVSLLVVGALLAVGVAMLLWPDPVPVETVLVHRGDLQEVVEEEGKTRMHDRFNIAAPVNGKLRRITLDAGDVVRAGQTVAWIDPAPIDPRQQAVLDARLNAALASKRQAEALSESAHATQLQAEQDLNRGQELFRHGVVSREALDRTMTAKKTADKQMQAATSAAEAARFQVEEARSALLTYRNGPSKLPTAIVSPVNGRVLRLLEQSEHVVATGTPLLEIGYQPRLEVVADFLTRDAVRIQSGMPAILTDWGGNHDLGARVRLVEPGAFTKISALGVEEQRVNVICDLTQDAGGLGDAYHAEVRVIVWAGHDVLVIPVGAVFRSSTEWAVFVVRGSVAHKQIVQIGHRGVADWEVLDGVREGDRIIVHPDANVADGVRVKEGS